ncbi:polysaccharide deacetylase family protein [Catellatospora bangladeshensis]|uniref:Lipoprotein n=2 Tax=Catellatospora bangladeshensis TaxID=310355 RepID=A0A8J3NK86_9ACTN|nr:polysaccharide deacetylase family protein [Catellatospora bangladeshensis]GIF81245.1 lipoprotein [Catellatospora bangladeshensis]
MRLPKAVPALLTAAAVLLAATACGAEPDVPAFVGGPATATPAAAAASPSTSGLPSPSAVATPTGRPRLPGQTKPGLLPPVVNHGPRAGGLVALTFDADMTDDMLARLRSGKVESYANVRIIELLERGKVPATFFLTGKWVQRYPELTRRIAGNQRFELANHTFGHQAFTPGCYNLPRIPPAGMTEDVAKTFRIIEGYGGRQTRYFRFPGLCHDRAALRALSPLGLTVVDGDVVSGDPFATDWRPIVKAVLSKVKPGSVVILHVTEANARFTDEALPHILKGLAERGLRPAPLSEVLAA